MVARRDSAANFEPEQDFGFEDMLRIMRRRWRLIVAVVALVTLATAGICLLLENRYQAVASVQIEPRRKQIVAIDAVVQEMRADGYTVESEVEIIRSRSVALRVIDELKLRDDPEFTGPSLLADLITLVTGKDPADAAPEPAPPAAAPGDDRDISGFTRTESGTAPTLVRDRTLSAFLDRLKARRVRNSLLIEVSFTAKDPVKAARIANAVVDAYLANQIEAKERATRLATSLLDERITKLRAELGAAEKRVEEFKSQNDMFDADGHMLVEKQLAREMEALVQARNVTAEARAKVEQARRMMLDGEGNEALADVLQSHTVRLLRDELAKALRREAELATRYGPKHPDMQKIAADVAKAQNQLADEVNKIIRNLTTEYQVAAAREADLAAGLDDLKRRVAAAKGQSWQLQELSRDATTSRQLYEALLARNKQTAETLGLQFPDARLVERASVPLVPAGPKRKQIVLLAAAASLAFAFALAFMLEVTLPGFQRPEEIERELDLPQIAALPTLLDQQAGPAKTVRSYRLMLAEPQGMFAEAIRSLRHDIDGEASAGRCQVALIASALPGEGSSIVTANLALHYALTGSRTLLVDGDLRRGSITRTLGIRGCPGLIDVLAHDLPADRAVLRDHASGLNLLPGLTGPQHHLSAAELLQSPRLAGAIAQLRDRFDVILIDGPPLLPVVDTRILAEQADRIAIVATWRHTPKALLKRAVRSLGPAIDRVMGIVVNRVDPDEHRAALGLPPDSLPRLIRRAA